MQPTSDTKFENPGKKPLGQLQFKVLDNDGTGRLVPALDIYWAPHEYFSTYISLQDANGRIKTGAELEEWHYETEFFRNDLEDLLKLNHHEFWSYMVYRKSVLAGIISFLQRATPFYINNMPIDKHDTNKNTAASFQLYTELLNSVLRIICRLVTQVESPTAWVEQKHLSSLLYDNCLLSVPMLLDLVIAIGDSDETNIKILSNIFDSLIKVDARYCDDLIAGLAYFRTAFVSIQTQTDNEGCDGAAGGATANDIVGFTPYDDVALYTLDCAYTLSILLELCSATLCPHCDRIKLAQNIANFYDNTLPVLYRNIHIINPEANSLNWLNQARLQFLNAFHTITNFYLIAANDSANPERVEYGKRFIELLQECLGAQTFVVDYERRYPVEFDMEILQLGCEDIKDYKISFIVNGYKKEADADAVSTIGFVSQQQQTNTSSAKTKKAHPAVKSTPKKEDKAIKKVSTVRDIDLEVTAVLDVLPDLGTGFIRRLLARYDNSEQAIAAILDDNLPPDLINANRTEPYIPPDIQDKVYNETNVKHYNIYDGDAYDVMTQDNPKCIIKKGKGFPNVATTAEQLLDEKGHLAELKERYQLYSLVDETAADENFNEYNDEYDDSYDAMLEGQVQVHKKKELKAGLANIADDTDESNDDEEATETSGASRDTRRDFCENPEDVRARYAARHQAKWGHKSNTAKPPPERSVVGAPKGQGQDKETIRNRNKKEVNKSSRANHNRKQGAAFKRSKGMIT